jgi:SAM-dependent methyltransferase
LRPTLRPEGLLEHLALRLNLAPTPVAEAMFGMATTRVVMAGVTLGVYAELARGAASPEEIASRRGLDTSGTRHLLECLAALGHVERRDTRYALTRVSRRWLDPASPTYVGGFLEFHYDQWDWWAKLEEAVRSGRSFEIHDFGPDDPRWRRYIVAMFQLARLSAPEVARSLRLPPEPQSLLDLGGGHGWFAAEICRRHPTLTATVLDLPGSVRIGREIIAKEGMSRRVIHREGDLLTDDLGGPHDGILCFQIIHHLTPEQNLALFERVRAALKPGGIFAVLDYFTPAADRKPDSAAFLGLHFYLTSTAATYAEDDLRGWLRQAGFEPPRRIRLRRLPIQALFEARRG